MVLTLAFAAALLVQTPHAPQPVGVWRSDSTLYVTLRQPGDLLVLHVDANGRIQVLFPASPDDGTAMLSNDTLVVIPLPPTAEGNPATFIAVRSRWAFDFAALRAGATWNYHDALLLQPTEEPLLVSVQGLALLAAVLLDRTRVPGIGEPRCLEVRVGGGRAEEEHLAAERRGRPEGLDVEREAMRAPW